MSRPIILITNTAPFSGEVFLRRELDWIPRDQQVILFPILAENPQGEYDLPNGNVQVVADASAPGLPDRILGLLRGLAAPLCRGELHAVFAHPHPLRNLLKAVKFAAVAEARAAVIARYLRQRFPGQDFVFYSYWLYEAGFAAARLAKTFPGSRFVSRCHGYDLYRRRHPNGYLPFRTFLLEQANRICPVSADGVAYLSRLYPAQTRDKLALMRLGTGDHGICTEPPTQSLTLVSCSNLVDVKRVDRIISALALLNVPVQWHHFGDGPLRAGLEQQAQTLPQHIRWHFHGPVPNRQLLAFYRTHYVDAFVNVSASEGVPVSIMEAMSFGMPIVATDVGGTGELVCHNENGFLLAPDFPPEALCQAILKLRPNRSRLGDASRARWERMCRAEENYHDFYTMLRQL